jgi:hypothetical protein
MVVFFLFTTTITTTTTTSASSSHLMAPQSNVDCSILVIPIGTGFRNEVGSDKAFSENSGWNLPQQGVHTNTREYYIGLLQHSGKVENLNTTTLFIEHQQKQRQRTYVNMQGESVISHTLKKILKCDLNKHTWKKCGPQTPSVGSGGGDNYYRLTKV